MPTDFPLVRNGILRILGQVPVLVHAGIECASWSKLGTNKRNPSNNFMGVSLLEYKANRDLQHLVALYYLLRRLRPEIIHSIENPGYEQGLAKHPLIRYLVEAGVEE